MSTLKRKAETQAGSEAKKAKASSNILNFFGPKSTSTSASSPTSAPAEPEIKFDKQKWLGGLTDEQKQLLSLEIETLHHSWLAHLKDDITSQDFLELKRFLNREAAAGKKVFPPPEDVYSWSRHTPFHNVKVVILGQDPYHNVNQAHGLAFSVRAPTPAPPSLRNIFVCLKNDYPSFVEPPARGGLLTPWAEQGVLLLNTCLTVRAHEANSHANRGWERFTQRIIELVASRRPRGVVFVAWGTPAGKRVIKLDKKKHLVLTAVHPSPLSAARGFFTCAHFRKANQWLAERYGDEGIIDWALEQGNSTKPAKELKSREEKEADAGVERPVLGVQAGTAKIAVTNSEVETSGEKKTTNVDVTGKVDPKTQVANSDEQSGCRAERAKTTKT